jgi:hypothetical protein
MPGIQYTFIYDVHLSYYQVSGVFLLQTTSTYAIPSDDIPNSQASCEAACEKAERQNAKLRHSLKQNSSLERGQSAAEKSGMVCPPLLVLDMEKKEETKKSEFAIHTSKARFFSDHHWLNMINYQYRFGVVGFGNTWKYFWDELTPPSLKSNMFLMFSAIFASIQPTNAIKNGFTSQS